LARLAAAWEARDWKHLAELFPAGFRLIDRRAMVQLELDRDQFLEWTRTSFEMSSSRLEQEVLATRGDRLALFRQRVEVADRHLGPSEIESLMVMEVDEHGERVAAVRFDSEDLDAAYTELDERYHAGEAAPHARVAAGMREFRRAFAERDWDALAARCAPDLLVHDHRLLGWETLRGPAAYIEALRALVELAPDTKLRLDHVTICESGYLVTTVWEGTREGGAYEAPSLMVAELDAQGRIRRFDQYDLERLDPARARYAELRPDPLRIPPNAATRAGERWLECVAAEDWECLRTLCAPTFVLDDRRGLMHLTGDCEMAVANNQVVAELGGRASTTVLATSGDRLALTHVRWTVGDEAAVSEVEILNVTEVDAEGRAVANIVFDPDARRAASAELLARDPHSDAVKRAMSDHDLDRLRAALPDDFVANDHRRTGFGQLGRDDYVDSLAALFGEAPDVIIETLYTVAAEKHGSLITVRMFGTLVDGGAFESVMVRLASFRGERIVGQELFEPEDLAAARARFDTLRSGLASQPR
jgi:DnaJ-domain-containing protein 1